MSGSSSPPRLGRRALDVRPGETLVQALARVTIPILGRSIRYHRPRAPFCGVGACSQCLVRVNGEPNVRACRYHPGSGDRIETENAWPSADHDVYGVFDLLFRHGFDSHRGFIRPAFLTRAFQRSVRHFAGYGRLAESGRRVLLVDRGTGTALPPSVAVRERSTVAFLPPPEPDRSEPFHLLAVSDEAVAVSVRAREVLLAPGGYDAGLVFDGNDRPGVFTAEGAELLVTPGTPPPFHGALVFGGGPRAARLIDRFGEFIDAVVAPGPIGPEVAERAAHFELHLYPRTLLVSASGRRRVRSVGLEPRGGGAAFSVAADAVLLAHRRLPNPQLFFQAGARMEWRASTGAYYPALSGASKTSVPGLFAAGEAAGFLPEDAVASGAAAAAELLGETPASALPERVDAAQPSELFGYFRELLPKLSGRRRAFLCPCEDILLGSLAEAHELGYEGIQVVKRFTDVGTGLCQGRYCLPDALLILSILENRPPPELGYITQRPPVLPATLGALADLPDPPVKESP
jgi:sarcosine oxidase subunit alpha